MAYKSCNRLVNQTQGLTNLVPCICHGSGDDTKDGSIFDFCVRCGIEQQACCTGLCHHIFML
ncbi:hypothetical protein T03_2146 [Trichinella britovi]|uniref:Uncharacterized protein n=1 Tax=Trichinella britovi TaxID=45882 RepID=A0A0V1ABA4_TRIBR|nr:hypothetical protein T03_2146 [Trichinella britovi]